MVFTFGTEAGGVCLEQDPVLAPVFAAGVWYLREVFSRKLQRQALKLVSVELARDIAHVEQHRSPARRCQREDFIHK